MMVMNENWDRCPVCGAPVMIDPQTGQPEECSSCVSRKSAATGWLGIWFIILLFLGTAAILYFSIRMLFPLDD